MPGLPKPLKRRSLTEGPRATSRATKDTLDDLVLLLPLRLQLGPQAADLLQQLEVLVAQRLEVRGHLGVDGVLGAAQHGAELVLGDELEGGHGAWAPAAGWWWWWVDVEKGCGGCMWRVKWGID